MSDANELEVRREKGKIWSHVRKQLLVETPEEGVRQEYLCILVNEYGFQLGQIAEEMEVTGRGSGQARADFVIWRTADDRREERNPLVVVECKADHVSIDRATYYQGENYARMCGAPFFVTHNNSETKYWRVHHDRMPKHFDEIANIPHADATDKEIEELLASLRVFKEDEFADLLHQCHNVIRNRDKLDPAAAFDEIAKILFMKVLVERRMKEGRQRRNLFSVEFLDEQAKVYGDPITSLFAETRRAYSDDQLFADESISLKPSTVREIVRLLEAYNLSDTSEDIKGIAFERFLGSTFRGEMGQFFTPRTIVEFMVLMLDPKEGDVMCDPASGSGGFPIRFFEIVREQILASVDAEYRAYSEEVEAMDLSEEEKAALKVEKYAELQRSIDPSVEGSRIWRLANRCIYGTDANDRMARTSKMNMIMHGDGHGGIHHHDGFLNVNGIFEGRFDIVFTNPPFGANVEPEDVILPSDVAVDAEAARRYRRDFGQAYTGAQARVRSKVGEPIGSLFDLPKSTSSKIKTELLFIERCLELLKPGGRMGIVLPEGVFNNPSLAYVREFVEDRAYIRAVVSLPQETFYSAGASVKASLLFLDKFTEEEREEYEATKKGALEDARAAHGEELEQHEAIIDQPRYRQADFLEEGKKYTREERATATAEAREAYKTLTAQKREARGELKTLEEQIAEEARVLLKERCAYPVFLYEAEKVGLTATGEPDQNELYPNDNQPPGLEKTCVELSREFREDAAPFFVKRPGA